MSNWYSASAQTEKIVVSTRIRLARNLSSLPFPERMTEEQRELLILKVKTAVKNSNTPLAKSLKFIDIKDVPDIELFAMAERHTISREFALSQKKRAIILSDDESISIMIGEEDHIRIQVLLGGLQLKKAYETAELVDSILNNALHFAFDKNLGYLTECPTNLGTGIRASVMLHLPLCEASGRIAQIVNNIAKLGFTMRGMFGEGSKPLSSLYQLSNQVTLGISEQNAIDNLKIVAEKLIAEENKEREKQNLDKIADNVYRALGILKYSRILSSEEMMDLLSRIKIGQDMGIIKESVKPIRLLIEAQPHMLMRKFGISDPQTRDINRAKYIREELNAPQKEE